MSCDHCTCLYAEQAYGVQKETAWRMGSPFVVMRPKLFLDGKKWCALYGENIQDGVVGFGDSPALAEYDFNEEWNKKLT